MAAGLAEVSAQLEAENRVLNDIKDLLQQMLKNDADEAKNAEKDRKRALEDRIEAKNKSKKATTAGGAFYEGLVGNAGVRGTEAAMSFFDKAQTALLGGISAAGLLASKGIGKGLRFGALALGINALAQEVIDNAFENMTFDDNLSEEEKKNIKDKASTAINTGFMLKFLGLPGWATLGGAVGTAFGNDIQAQMMTYFDKDGDGKLEVAGFDLGKPEYAEAIGGAAGLLAMGIIKFVGRKFALLAAGAGLATLLANAGYKELATLIGLGSRITGKKVAQLSAFRNLEYEAGEKYRQQQAGMKASLGVADLENQADNAAKLARKEAAETAARISAVKSGLSLYRPMKVGSAPITGGTIADDALKGLKINMTGDKVTGYMQDGKFIKPDVAVQRLAAAGLSPTGMPIAPTVSTSSYKPKVNIKAKVRNLKNSIARYAIAKMPLVLGKAVWGFGVGIGIGMSAWNAIRGDYTSASLNAGATVAGVVPIVGTAASLTTDLASIPTMVFFDFSPQFFPNDIPPGSKGIPFNPNDPNHVEAMIEISAIVKEAIDEYMAKSKEDSKNLNVLSAEAYAGFSAEGAAMASSYNMNNITSGSTSIRGTDTRIIRSRNFGADMGIGGSAYGITGIGIQENYVPIPTSAQLESMKTMINSMNNTGNTTVIVESPQNTEINEGSVVNMSQNKSAVDDISASRKLMFNVQ